MNTDDKFHPLNTLQRALDYGEPLDRDEVRDLIAAYAELEGDQRLEVQELEEQVADLEDQRDKLEDRLDQTQKALETFVRLAEASAKERLGA